MKRLLTLAFLLVALTGFSQNPSGTARDFWHNPITLKLDKLRPVPTGGTQMIFPVPWGTGYKWGTVSLSELLPGSGNTIYVSTAYGNNATAEIGNPTKPYLTAASALSVYTVGNIINVLDGTHSFTLTSDTINFIGNKGSQIILSQADSTSYQNNVVTVVGDVVKLSNYNVSKNSKLTVDCDSLHTVGLYCKQGSRTTLNAINWSYTNAIILNPAVADTIKSIFTATALNAHMQGELFQSGSGGKNATANVTIGTLYTPASGVGGGCIVNNYRATQDSISYNFKIGSIEGKGSTCGLVFMAPEELRVRGVVINFDIGTAIGLTNIVNAYAVSSNVATSVLINVNIENYRLIGATDPPMDLGYAFKGVRIVLSGNYFIDSAVPFLKHWSGGDSPHVEFYGNYYINTTALIQATKATTSAFFYFGNAKVIAVTAATPVVTASAALNIFSSGLNTNSSGAWTNVTVVGVAALINSSFK